MPRSSALNVFSSGVERMELMATLIKHFGDCPMIFYVCEVNLNAVTFSEVMLDTDLSLLN